MSTASRREFLLTAAATAVAPVPVPLSICAFSKHFHWTTIPNMAALCADLGYDAIDLTLRPGGHVLPERVQDDLPLAAEQISKAGCQLGMATTHIVDATTPHAEAVVKTLASLGIRRYRWGGFRYDFKRPITAQLDEFKLRVKDLAALNRQYGVCAMYHTHSGVGQVGASFWDLYHLLKDFSPEAVSANYDIGHATVEGGFGGWINSIRLLLPFTRGIAIKDFFWTKSSAGRWSPGWCALGQGMVQLTEFLSIVKQGAFAGPIQLHFEYPELGDAATGKTTMSIPQAGFLAIHRRDLALLRKLTSQVGLLS
jgi:sugar phosphate isomerase/epimerase